MPDYSKTIIYKLCCKNLDVKEIYVGSTCNFTRRKNAHKTDSSNLNSIKYNTKVYKFIRDNGNFQNWEMIMVEEYPCENKMQKLKRERYWCEELKSELNSDVPGRSDKESVKFYQTKNKDAINQKRRESREKNKEYSKEYRENNPEKVKQQRKKYYEKNKHKLDKEKLKEYKKQYYEANKDAINQRRKENREANKEKNKDKQKKYYDANKDVINQRRRESRARKKNELLKDKE
jgi:hypothetical protein